MRAFAKDDPELFASPLSSLECSETTRDDVRISIHDFLYSETTGLPLSCYSEQGVGIRSEFESISLEAGPGTA